MTKKYGFINIRQLFLSLLPAQIFAFLTSSLGGIVNGLVIGNYLSSLDMIALGFANPIVLIVSVSSMIVSSGARILCGKFIGKGEKKKINETFSTSIFCLLVIGVVLSVAIIIFAKPIALLFGTSPEVLEKTCLYLRGIGIGIIPTVISPCLMVFMQMQNEMNQTLIATVMLAVLNLLLGIGAMKLIHISIFGVGVVTSLSQYLTLAYLCFRFYKNKNLPRIIKIEDKSLFKETLLLGAPTALANILYALRNSILNVIANNIYGAAAVNALSILTSSSGPIDAFNAGVGSTQLMLASVYVGEKDKEALKSLSSLSLFYGLIIAAVKFVLIFLFAKNIALFFGANQEVVLLTDSLYKFYAITFPLNIFTQIIIGTHQAFKRIGLCNTSYIIGALVSPVAIAYFLGSAIGINGVWSSFYIAEIIQLIFIYIVVCIIQKKIIIKPSGILMIDETLQTKNAIFISINNINEVIDISKRIQEYCIKENIDKKRSMIAGLCCEEIATNIVEHGFTKSKRKNKMMDIYACVENDEINIRIKDNAVAFDPHIKIYDNEDPTTNIGIKMVANLSKEMYYQNTFGLNVLSIRL